MTPYRDYDGTYKLPGHHQHSFSSEADALAAAALAKDHFDRQIGIAMSQESRYRRAAERASEVTA